MAPVDSTLPTTLINATGNPLSAPMLMVPQSPVYTSSHPQHPIEMMVQHQDEDPDSLASVSTLVSTVVEPTDPLPKAGQPPCATIDEFLHKANLIEYKSALRAAGVVEIDDIICMEDEDLAEIGMCKVELRRCRRLLANN